MKTNSVNTTKELREHIGFYQDLHLALRHLAGHFIIRLTLTKKKGWNILYPWHRMEQIIEVQTGYPRKLICQEKEIGFNGANDLHDFSILRDQDEEIEHAINPFVREDRTLLDIVLGKKDDTK